MTPPPFSLAGSLAYGLAYGVGALAFWRMAVRRKLATEGIAWVAVAGLVGGLLGATILQFLATGGTAGKSVLGGWIGGILGVWGVKRAMGLKRPTGDLFAVALMAGEAVGRWGCFFSGCCYGQVCALPWAVSQHDALRHPTHLYLSLACAMILLILVLIERTRPRENTLFVVQGLLYSSARFSVEFFRQHDGPPHFGLHAAQWACLAGLLFFTERGYRLWAQK